MSDLYVFDLDTFVWEKVSPHPDDEAPSARYFHSADSCECFSFQYLLSLFSFQFKSAFTKFTGFSGSCDLFTHVYYDDQLLPIMAYLPVIGHCYSSMIDCATRSWVETCLSFSKPYIFLFRTIGTDALVFFSQGITTSSSLEAWVTNQSHQQPMIYVF